jgi:hypothetical protein
MTRAKSNTSYARAYIEGLGESVKTIAERSQNVEGVYVYLNADIYKDNDSIIYLWYDKENGTLVATEDTEASLPDYLSTTKGEWRDDPDYVWYYQPLIESSPTWTDIYYDTDLHENSISYALPIYSHQKIIGITGIDIDLTMQAEQLATSDQFGNSVVLMDQHEHVIVGGLEMFDDYNATRLLLTDDRGGFTQGKQDIGYHKLQNGMIAFAILDEEQETNPIDTAQLLFLYTFASLGILCLIGGLLLAFPRVFRHTPMTNKIADAIHPPEQAEKATRIDAPTPPPPTTPDDGKK